MFFLRHKAHLCSVLISDKHGAVQNFPLLLQEPDLASKPIILLSEAEILFRNHVCISVRGDPFDQRAGWREALIMAKAATISRKRT